MSRESGLTFKVRCGQFGRTLATTITTFGLGWMLAAIGVDVARRLGVTERPSLFDDLLHWAPAWLAVSLVLVLLWRPIRYLPMALLMGDARLIGRPLKLEAAVHIESPSPLPSGIAFAGALISAMLGFWVGNPILIWTAFLLMVLLVWWHDRLGAIGRHENVLLQRLRAGRSAAA